MQEMRDSRERRVVGMKGMGKRGKGDRKCKTVRGTRKINEGRRSRGEGEGSEKEKKDREEKTENGKSLR